nr:hypothetical protein B0A51_11317 [Rachicladosporium sp. CCFEE 5018]
MGARYGAPAPRTPAPRLNKPGCLNCLYNTKRLADPADGLACTLAVSLQQRNEQWRALKAEQNAAMKAEKAKKHANAAAREMCEVIMGAREPTSIARDIWMNRV